MLQDRFISCADTDRTLLRSVQCKFSAMPHQGRYRARSLQSSWTEEKAVRVAVAQSMPQREEAVDAMVERTHDVSPEHYLVPVPIFIRRVNTPRVQPNVAVTGVFALPT
eukprot:1145843-Pelagomonas_calceolata.AAC.12